MPKTWLVRLAIFALVLLGACTLGGRTASAAPIKVACIGEHTTHSNLFQNNDREHQPVGMQEYPMKLQALLGAGYDVRNFGDCCASVVQGYNAPETHPYISGGNFKNSIAFAPDIVVVGSWGRHDWGLSAQNAFDVFTPEKFQTDYEALIKRYQDLSNHPKIYLSLPIPILFGTDVHPKGVKTSTVVAVIKAVAVKFNLPTIDLYGAFTDHKELFINPPLKDSEGEHANDAGLQKIADVVAAALLSGDVPSPGGGGASSGGVSTGGAGEMGDSGSAVGGGGGNGGNGGIVNGGAGGGSGSAGTGIAGSSAVGGSVGSGIAGMSQAGTDSNAGAPPGSDASGCSCRVGLGANAFDQRAAVYATISALGLLFRRGRRRQLLRH
jgi:hypothetical protein